MKSGEAERLWKLQTSANDLVLSGKRDADPLIKFLQEFVLGTEPGPKVWHEAYKLLGLEVEYGVFVEASPVREDQNLWIVPVIKGATPGKVVAVLSKLGVDVCTFPENLDKGAITRDDRNPANGSYWIGFVKNVETDEENEFRSDNHLAEFGQKGITLLERLLLELGYFLATGNHLNVESATLCTGSRSGVNYVPEVNWNPDNRRVYVGWCAADGSDDDPRSRFAVSLPS